MEERFGVDFSRVRIHSGDVAARSADEVGARAYTVGHRIVFGAGEWRPGTDEGRRLLAHELHHVVQQVPVTQRPAAVGGNRSSASPGTARDPGHHLRRQVSGGCHPTARWPGNIEHLLIEQDYVTNVNPGGGAVEYAIPGSGPNGGTGYADMVDLVGHRVYEIKTFVGAPQGVTEARRYADKAQEHCPPPIPMAPWRVGDDYPHHTIPMAGNEELVVQQYPPFPGVVVYYRRLRRRQPVPEPGPSPVPIPVPGDERERERDRPQPTPQPTPFPVPSPVPVPQAGMQQIREFLERVVQSGDDVEAAARQFLADHPELVYVIAGLAVGIFLGTIIEDILTAGAGIADDPPTMAAAWTLWRVAMQLQTAR
jgi:hypothetical protein